MKNKIVACLFKAAFVMLLVSCNDVEKSNFDKPSPATKEKKVSRIVKTKKKKESAKPINKIKTESLPPKKEEGEEESSPTAVNTALLTVVTGKINTYAAQNGYSTQYCFLVDMSLPSGRNRFFVYDLTKNSVVYSGLVAHGSCNETFLSRPRFSNAPKCGCSSLGKYKVGEFYTGKYGKSFRLYGLDNCNSNAYKRAVVIHGYDCVPDEEIYPRVLCNSLGCVMVSYNFFDRLSRIISKSEKPIILWVYQ